MQDRPSRRLSILDPSSSMPRTVYPLRANSHASGNPTYPSPITPNLAWRVRIFASSASAAPDKTAGRFSTLATATGPSWPWRGFRLRAVFTSLGCLTLLLSFALLSRTFVALSLFRSLFSVMTHQPLPYTALLNPCDHIL